MADAEVVRPQERLIRKQPMLGTLLLIGLASGALLGLVFALVSTGFNVSLGVSRVVNLQHGATILWSMYAAFFLWTDFSVNPYLSLLLLGPLAFGLGYAMYRLLIVRSLALPEDSQILFSMGVLIALQYLAQFCFTTDARSLANEQLQDSLVLGPLVIQYGRIVAGVVALAVLAALHLMLVRSDLGRHLRACAQNPVGARVCGLNVEHLSAVALGISAVCGAVSGVALSTLVPIYPDRAFEYAILAIVVSALGGMGSMVGSVLGGLLTGIIVAICQSMGYGAIAQAIVYGLVFLIFLFRPTGLVRSPAAA